MKVQEWIQTVNNYSYNQKEKFRQDIENAEKKLNDQIKDLQQQAENASGEVKNKYEQAIRSLNEKKKEVNRKMNILGNVIEKDWDNFKVGINSAWGEIQDTWDKLDDKLNND